MDNHEKEPCVEVPFSPFKKIIDEMLALAKEGPRVPYDDDPLVMASSAVGALRDALARHSRALVSLVPGTASAIPAVTGVPIPEAMAKNLMPFHARKEGGPDGNDVA